MAESDTPWPLPVPPVKDEPAEGSENTQSPTVSERNEDAEQDAEQGGVNELIGADASEAQKTFVLSADGSPHAPTTQESAKMSNRDRQDQQNQSEMNRLETKFGTSVISQDLQRLPDQPIVRAPSSICVSNGDINTEHPSRSVMGGMMNEQSVETWIPELPSLSVYTPSIYSNPGDSGYMSTGPSVPHTLSAADLSVPGRRPNPKSIATRRSNQSHSDTMRHNLPQVDYRVRGNVPEAGNLYRICDSVPYLLGPKSYLEALVRMSSAHVPSDIFKDEEGKFIINPHMRTPLDKVLMLILTLIQTPNDQRSEAIMESLHGFTTLEDRLIVYKDIGWDERPELIPINSSDFLVLMRSWEQLPNPYLVAEENPAAQTKWSDLAKMLRKRNIRLQDIDRALCDELTDLPPQDLGPRLEKLACTGELQHRKRLLQKRIHAAQISNVFHYTAPPPTNNRAPYTMRFSHKHPKGILLDTTKPRHDGMYFSEEKVKEQDAKEKEKEAALKRKKEFKSMVIRKGRRYCKWIIWLIVILGVAVAILLFAHFRVGDTSGGKPLGG